MCVCVCACMCLHVCARKHIHAYACTCQYTFTPHANTLSAQMHIHSTCMCVHKLINTRTHPYTPTRHTQHTRNDLYRVVVLACPTNCDHCETDADGNNGKCLAQQCDAEYAIKTDRICYRKPRPSVCLLHVCV